MTDVESTGKDKSKGEGTGYFVKSSNIIQVRIVHYRTPGFRTCWLWLCIADMFVLAGVQP